MHKFGKDVYRWNQEVFFDDTSLRPDFSGGREQDSILNPKLLIQTPKFSDKLFTLDPGDSYLDVVVRD